MGIKIRLLFLCLSTILAFTWNEARGNLTLESTSSYLKFDVALENGTSQLTTLEGQSFFLIRKYLGASDYIWLQRNNSDPSKPLLYRRNYKDEGNKFLSGYSVKGIVVDEEELQFIVALNDDTKDLCVLTIGLKYTLNLPINLNYRYYIQDEKKIPKNVELENEIYISWCNFLDPQNSEVGGKRIIIAGTSKSQNLFVAVFNTYYNLTEFVYEKPFETKEIARKIQIDSINNNFVLISDIFYNDPLELSCLDKPSGKSPTWNVAVRAFSFDRFVMEWNRVLGHNEYNDTYVSSVISGNYLLIMYNTNKSHQSTALTGNITEVEFAVVRLETGEGSNDDCKSVFTSDSRFVKGLDLVSAHQGGIYALIKATAGNIQYIRNSLSFNVQKDSLLLAVIGLVSQTDPATPVPFIYEMLAYPYSLHPQVKYSPTKLIVYFPSGYNKAPDLSLAGHLSSSTGLIIYGFNDVSSGNYSGNNFSCHNPFVTDSGCSSSGCKRCLVGNVAKCVECTSGYYLADFSCTPGGCPSGFFLSNNTVCTACHYSCQTCSGPLRSQCLTCDTSVRAFNQLTSECDCLSGSPFVAKGVCVSTCLTGQSGYTSHLICVNQCPAYTFHYVNYESDSGPPVTATLGIEGSTDLLEFASSSGCLQLPGPTDYSSLPKEFSVGFWLYRGTSWTTGEKILLWGFNSFVVLSNTDSTSDSIQVVLKNSGGSEVRFPTTSPATAVLVKNAWNYIAFSMKRNSTGITSVLIVIPKGTSRSAAGHLDNASVISFPAYINKILLGCTGSYNSVSGQFSVTNTINFNGYIREFVYIERFQEKASLEANQNRGYSSCLKFYPQVLSYWRMDSIAETTSSYVISDSSKFGQSVSIPKTLGYPKKSTSSANMLVTSKWDNFGSCIDIHSDSLTPHLSISPVLMPIITIEYKIGLFNSSVINSIFGENDYVMFKNYLGCDKGTTIAKIDMYLQDGSMKVNTSQKLPLDVYGRFLWVCYYSYKLKEVVSLGQVYFANIPSHITPAHGSTDKVVSEKIQFSIVGGDQTLYDHLILLSLEKNIEKRLEDSILIDETQEIYKKYTMDSTPSSGFSSLDSSTLDAATYTLLWRPNFIKYKSSGNFIEYKNLFISWAIQDVPQVKFDLDESTLKSLNSILFKGETFYLNIVGPGQMDGDQIIFCKIGCHFSNLKGQIFTRKNGKYPPVWLGENIGVSGLISESYTRVYICWRPAGRAKALLPSEDMWSSILEDSIDQKKSFITINSKSQNENLVEIEEIHPSFSDPVLRFGESIWFRFSKCLETKIRPSSYSGTPGKVALVHLTYTSTDHLEYSNTTIWEQEFAYLADAGSVVTEGNLEGDASNCNYTLKNLPHSLFLPGHRYRLVIYTRSFISPVTGKYFLGAQEARLPKFQFEFIYQQFSIDSNQFAISPEDTEFTITGTNLGRTTISGSTFIDSYNLYGAAINMSVSPTCSSLTAPTVSFRVLSIKNLNLTEIKLTSLSQLSSCRGSIYLNMTLYKINYASKNPTWYTATVTSVLVGTVNCHYSCSTCKGISYKDCVTCDTTTQLQYLYQGECRSECGSEYPVSMAIYEDSSSVILYYKCVSECPEGYFYSTSEGTCLECNTGCRICASNAGMSCLECLGSVQSLTTVSESDDNRIYYEKFFINGMCVNTCPDIGNDLSPSYENLVSANPYLHICEIASLPSGVQPISVKIQPIAYRVKLNVQLSTKLRAIITDPTHSLVGLYWHKSPAEDTSQVNFYTSDSRFFDDYSSSKLNSTLVDLNMNFFNYLEEDSVKIVVKVFTGDSLGYDIIELLGNRAPDLQDCTINLSYSGETMKTLSYINISIEGIQDTDDYVRETLKFKVYLKPKKLAIPNTVTSASVIESLSLKASLNIKQLTIFGFEAIAAESKTVKITNIYIPPVLDGKQLLDEGVYTDNFTASIIVLVEDRHQGSTQVSLEYNITEMFNSTLLRTELLQNLYEKIISLKQSEKMSWEISLRAANTFRVALPTTRYSFLSYTNCTRDSQCFNGKCSINGGFGVCLCDIPYGGDSCALTINELKQAKSIFSSVIAFLYHKLVFPLKGSDFKIEDTRKLDQLASALAGLLIYPEIASTNQTELEMIVGLLRYLTRINIRTALRLEEEEIKNIFTALDNGIRFILYSQKKRLYDMQVTQDSYNYEIRQNMSQLILNLTEGLANFADKLAAVKNSGDNPTDLQHNLFGVFILSETRSILDNADGFLGIKAGTTTNSDASTGFVLIPKNVLSSAMSQYTEKEEIKIRLIYWMENPYIFSRYHSEVFSGVQSLRLMDNNGTDLALTLTEPIVFFLPVSNMNKNFPNEHLRCMYFNHSYTSTKTMIRYVNLDLDSINSTQEEKLLLCPEYNSGFFHIWEGNVKYTDEISWPEFVLIDGVGSYSNVLQTKDFEDYIPCSSYFLSEVAAVSDKKVAGEAEVLSTGFYYSFNPLEYWKATLGFYSCLGALSFFTVMYILSIFLDWKKVPELERLIQRNRERYDDIEIPDCKPSQVQFNEHISLENLKKDKEEPEEEYDDPEEKKGRESDIKFESSVMDKTEEKFPTKSIELSDLSIQQQTKKNENLSTINIFATKECFDLKSRDNPQQTSVDGTNKMFDEVDAKDIRGEKSNRAKIKDIFSEKHIRYRTRLQYSLKNLLIQGNSVLNLLLRTSTTYSRTHRCILMFLSFYFQMLWCAVFICHTKTPLDHPDDLKKVYDLLSQDLWIPFVSPIFSLSLLYLFAMLFHVSDDRVLQTRTFGQYKRLIKEINREMKLRRILGCITAIFSAFGISYYLITFSAEYGWKMSSVWFWSFILAFAIDILLYDLLLAFVNVFLFRFFRILGVGMYNLRVKKQAGIQE